MHTHMGHCQWKECTKKCSAPLEIGKRGHENEVVTAGVISKRAIDKSQWANERRGKAENNITKKKPANRKGKKQAAEKLSKQSSLVRWALYTTVSPSLLLLLCYYPPFLRSMHLPMRVVCAPSNVKCACVRRRASSPCLCACVCSQKTDCLVVLRIAYAVENVPQYCGREIHVYMLLSGIPGVYGARSGSVSAPPFPSPLT